MVDVNDQPASNGLPSAAQPWVRDLEETLRTLREDVRRNSTNTDSAIAASGNAVLAAANAAQAHLDTQAEATRTPATIDSGSFILTPSTYFDATTGAPSGRIDVQIFNSDLDVDGNSLFPSGFEVWGRVFYADPDIDAGDLTTIGYGPAYRRLAGGPLSNLQVNGLQVGETYQMRVCAVSGSGVSGQLSDYLTTFIPDAAGVMVSPDAPSLTSERGILSVVWSGLCGGAAPATQFRYVFAEVSPAGRNDWTRMGSTLLRGGGTIPISGLVVGNSYDVRLVAVDSLGVVTDPSPTKTIAVSGVNVQDVAQGLLDQINAALQAGTDAQQAADGLSKITYSTNPAPTDGSGGTDGDTWFQRNANGSIIAQWTHVAGAWSPVTVDGAVLANVDAGKITVGQLDGRLIKAGTIMSNQLLVGDFTNLLDDPYFAAGTIGGQSPAWSQNLNAPYWFSVPPNGYGAWTREMRLQSDGSAGDVVLLNSAIIPAQQGDTFYIEVGSRTSNGIYSTGWCLYANFADGTRTWVDYQYGTADGVKSKNVVLPAGVVSVQLGLVARTGIPNGLAAVFWNPVMRRTMNGTLLVDGAITAAKLATDSVTANAIKAGALDAMVITAPIIRSAASGQRVQLDSAGLRGFNSAGTVVTQVGTTGALTATGATITGTIQTGTSGQRAVMSGSGINWYGPASTLGGSIVANTYSGTTSNLAISSGSSGLIIGKNDMPRSGTADVSSSGSFYASSIFNGDGYLLPTIMVGTFSDPTTVQAGASHNTSITWPGTIATAPRAVLVMPGNARFTPGVSSVTNSGAVVSLANWSTGAGIPGACSYVAFW